MPRREPDAILILKWPKLGKSVRLDLPETQDRGCFQVKTTISGRPGDRINSQAVPEATATEIGHRVRKMLSSHWGQREWNRR